MSYVVPQSLHHGDIERYLTPPAINAPISERLSFWPQVRNRMDAEKVHLFCIESERGNYFELWYPGYVWADTEDLWRPEGLEDTHNDGMLFITNPALKKAMTHLQELEPSGECHWTLFDALSFSGTENPRPFPITVATLNVRNESKESVLSLAIVCEYLSTVFQ